MRLVSGVSKNERHGSEISAEVIVKKTKKTTTCHLYRFYEAKFQPAADRAALTTGADAKTRPFISFSFWP